MSILMGGVKLMFCGELCGYTWLRRLLGVGSMGKILALKKRMRDVLVKDVETTALLATFAPKTKGDD